MSSQNLQLTSHIQQRRATAVAQAEEVLAEVGGSHHLDGFNLLGVIANPRGAATTTTISSHHGRYTEAEASTGNSYDYYYASLESTLTSVTEQLAGINSYLEDWSRHILEDDYVYDEDFIPEAQLTELPAELEHLDTTTLSHLVDSSGSLAAAFRNRVQSKSGSGSSLTGSWVEGVPSVFLDADFDLMQPDVFDHLLLSDMVDIIDDDQDAPISSWLPLVPEDAFSRHLDKIELELLHQVRSQSGAFFEESNRMSQLQTSIVELLQQVHELLESIRTVKQNVLHPLERVPLDNVQRQDLVRLNQILDEASDLLRSKESISGFLSAHDDVTAMQRIQACRQSPWLRKLAALHTLPQQLDHFEQIISSNLRDELVEIFITWDGNQNLLYSVGTAKTRSRPQQQARIREICDSLANIHGALASARTIYSQRLQEIVRMTVRTIVGEFAADTDSDRMGTIASDATSMTLDRFLDCLSMIFEQVLGLLNSVSSVNEFLVSLNLSMLDDNGKPTPKDDYSIAPAQQDDTAKNVSTPLASALASGGELASKSVAELLRLRKESHSLVTLAEMKRIWETCSSFSEQLESVSGHKASALRSTLSAQAKYFLERKHESNMSALVAALDSERWVQVEVSTERQTGLTRLCNGLTLVPLSISQETHEEVEKKTEVEVEGIRYKVVWSCLLLMEMILNNIAAATQFSSLSLNALNKTVELLRLFNSRTAQLVLGAGAIHSAARLKSINAKHLSLVAQCLGMVIAVQPHIRAALMAQIPVKQQRLLGDLDTVKKDYNDHSEKVLNKFVSIIGGIVEHSLSPQIGGIDFDQRANLGPSDGGGVACCAFLEDVLTNVKKMHQVLKSLLPPSHLVDVFSRIFAYLDQKIPALFQAALSPSPSKAGTSPTPFCFPTTNSGKERMLLELNQLADLLNELEGVESWDFTLSSVVGSKLLFKLSTKTNGSPTKTNSALNSNALGSMEHAPAAQPAEVGEANGFVPETDEDIANGDSQEPHEPKFKENDADEEEPKMNGDVADNEATLEPNSATAVGDNATETVPFEEPQA